MMELHVIDTNDIFDSSVSQLERYRNGQEHKLRQKTIYAALEQIREVYS